MAERVTEPLLRAVALCNLTYVATDQDDPAANSYLVQFLATARAQQAAQTGLADAMALAGLHALLVGRPREAVADAVEGLQVALACGQRFCGDLWCLEVLACAWTAQGQMPEQAARLLGAVAHLRQVMFPPRFQRLAALVEQAGAALRAVLGEAAFAAAY